MENQWKSPCFQKGPWVTYGLHPPTPPEKRQGSSEDLDEAVTSVTSDTSDTALGRQRNGRGTAWETSTRPGYVKIAIENGDL